MSKPSFRGRLSSFIRESFEYETTKVVQIADLPIGICFRAAQCFIILYVALYVMWYQKGYQYFDPVQSAAVAKTKGIEVVSNVSLPLNRSVWDSIDLVSPAQQNSAFFITTNIVVTERQRQGTCDESLDVYKSECNVTSSAPCQQNTVSPGGNGPQTGRCIPSTQNRKRYVCEIRGWCPTENDRMPLPDDTLFRNVKNFTVLIKNSIRFHHYKVNRRNILPWMENNNGIFLKTCRHDASDSKQKYCPLFRLQDIAHAAAPHDEGLWIYGGLMQITIQWYCNLDFGEDACLPRYSFDRLDDPDARTGRGWNFRDATYALVNGTYERTLFKRYGIQFTIEVVGSAGKFDFVTFSMNVGSGIALLGMATLLMDMVVFNVTKHRKKYRDARTDVCEVQDERRFSIREEVINIMRSSAPLKLALDGDTQLHMRNVCALAENGDVHISLIKNVREDSPETAEL